jgi:hypothetical protein
MSQLIRLIGDRMQVEDETPETNSSGVDNPRGRTIIATGLVLGATALVQPLGGVAHAQSTDDKKKDDKKEGDRKKDDKKDDKKEDDKKKDDKKKDDKKKDDKNL